MAAFLPSYFPSSLQTFRVSTTSPRGPQAPPFCQQRPNPPPRRPTSPQPLTPPSPPAPDTPPAGLPPPSAAAAGLRRPKDPTAMRTESERRRNAPAHGVARRRRRRSLAEDFDWEGAESVPLASQRASPSSGEDYWVELKPLAELRKQRRRRTKKPIDDGLRSKLKNEVVSPYANNWILWAILLVFVLALLVKLVGTDIPIISIPDV